MSPFTALLLTGGFWSPIDLTAPKAVGAVRARMLALCEGITEVDACSRLGLADQTPVLLGGTMHGRMVLYSVGGTHTLWLDFRHDRQRGAWLLHRAELRADFEAHYQEVQRLLQGRLPAASSSTAREGVGPGSMARFP